MLRFKVLVVPFILALSVGFTSCTQDEEKVDEAVTPDSPGTPEDAGSIGANAGAISAQTIYFAFDDYTLNAEGQAYLNTLSEALKADNSAVVQIEGHCDERGSIEYNLALGDRRAQSVKNYLTQLGVDASRLTTISYGEEKPVAEGSSESSWSRNRRAEFVVSTQ